MIDGFDGPDPAERSWFMRLFYRNRRPTWFGHLNGQLFCWWVRAGGPPDIVVALEVPYRVNGQKRQDPVVVATVNNERYICSMFGTISDWVQNLEASEGFAVIWRTRPERVRLVLIPVEERAPVLAEWVRIASSGRKHFPLPVGAPLAKFAMIAHMYPVYRVQSG